jgi:hypothetical protein
LAIIFPPAASPVAGRFHLLKAGRTFLAACSVGKGPGTDFLLAWIFLLQVAKMAPKKSRNK